MEMVMYEELLHNYIVQLMTLESLGIELKNFRSNWILVDEKQITEEMGNETFSRFK